MFVFVMYIVHSNNLLNLGEACYSFADTAEGCYQDHGQTPGTLRLSQSSLLALLYYSWFVNDSQAFHLFCKNNHNI